METIVNPDIPYGAPILNGLSFGGEIKIQGVVPLDSNGFKICLQCNNRKDSDIPLQIEANTINFTLALNSALNNEQCQTIVLSNIILRHTEEFEITIQFHATQFLILINNQICGHYPRIPQMEHAGYLRIEGQVCVENICSTPTPNGFKHNSRLPPPTYDEASQKNTTDYGSCPLPMPSPGAIPFPMQAPIISGITGYQTYLVQTGTYPLQSVTTAPANQLYPLNNNRQIRRSNYKTYLGWICVAFFIIIILLAILFSKNNHDRVRQHHREWLHDN